MYKFILILINDDTKTNPTYIQIDLVCSSTVQGVKALNQRAVGGILLGNAVVPEIDDPEKGVAEFWISDSMDYWISQGEGEHHRFPLDSSTSRRKYWLIKVHVYRLEGFIWAKYTC